MSNREDLLQARADLAIMLDEKLKHLPEWRALRAMDKAIAALGPPEGLHESAPSSLPTRIRLQKQGSYADLGFSILEEVGKPLSTPEIVAAVATRRGVDAEAKRVAIQTSLSKDKRIHSIPWRGGRAWWLADHEPPKEIGAS